MQHNLKFGVVAMVAVFGGGSFYLGAAEAPAFAQATTNGSTGQSATTGTTTGGATAQPQRRVNRPRPGAGVSDVRGGQGLRGSPTNAEPVPLTAAECTSLGGQVIAVGGITCPRLNGPDGGGQICSVIYHGTSPDGQPLTDRRDTCITSLR